MRILLIHPPHDLMRSDRPINYDLDTSQPLGLGYIAAALEQAGHSVRVIDAKVEKLTSGAIAGKVVEFAPQVVGIGAYTADYCVAEELAKEIKSRGNYTIIIGGRHVSALPEETMQAGCFDFGVIGEGEKTTVELVNAISAGVPEAFLQINGIIFRNGADLVRTPPRAYIDDLDSLSFPARHLFPPLKRYNRVLSSFQPPRKVCILTSRGCCYRCTFCDHAVFGNRIRFRSINNVLDEIEILKRQHGVRNVNIVDELFTLYPERVEQFCCGLKQRNIKITWTCFARVDQVTPKMLKLMCQAGCWMIGYGIESGDQKVLDTIKKDVVLEKVEPALRWTSQAGIITLGYFIFGLPGDNAESMRKSLILADKLSFDRVGFSVAQPYPGSELYKTALALGQIRKDVEFRHYHNYCFPEKLAYIAQGLDPEALRRAVEGGLRDFYLRPRYLLRQFFSFNKKAFLKQVFFLLRAILALGVLSAWTGHFSQGSIKEKR